MKDPWQSCNILQYELFVKSLAFRSLTKDVVDTTRANQHLELESKTLTANKVVVRVFDVEGRVTELGHYIKSLEHKREQHFSAKRSNLLSNAYARWHIARLNRHIDKVQREVLEYLVDYLCTAYPSYWEVAIETLGHEFRTPTPSEFLTLLIAVKQPSQLWLFVFEPNDLVAEKNRLIVSVM